MNYRRKMDIRGTLARKSAFLFGPRSVGKTSLWAKELVPDRIYDLLDAKTLKRLLQNQNLIFEEVERENELIVIDEVQLNPGLLNVVQKTIEEKKTRFLLTGSSQRKLLRSDANLLGGRASKLEMFPLSFIEIPDFDLKKYLNHGGVPRHYLTPSKYIQDELDDYVSNYLRDEIAKEAVTRNLEAFHRFLEIMAIHSGDELAMENFASDCGVKVGTFRSYLQILKETLLGFEVTPFLATEKRKAITRSKFFLFDVGVTGFLAGRKDISEKTEMFGKAFEHFIAMELRCYLSYQRKRLPLAYWRSKSQFEVDFVVGREFALEVKGVAMVGERHLKGLAALREEGLLKKYLVVSLDEKYRKIGPYEIYPWKMFLEKLWADEFM